MHEIIREQGMEELRRTNQALAWSGLAAGMSMGMSMLAMAFLMAHLPAEPWAMAIAKLGYSAGFIIVILARQQLFTENTITVLLPVVAEGHLDYLLSMLRLWGVVLLANMAGAMLFSLAVVHTDALDARYREATFEIGHHLMSNSPMAMFLKGIVAGWLIAGLVWMLPSADGARFWVILFITYLIALGDLTHIVAGSAEAFSLALAGEESWFRVVFVFLLPTLAGNTLGGAALFSLISYAQVRLEIN